MAYGMELRRRVLAAVDEKRGTQAEVARMFDVSERWVRKLLALRRATGSVEPSRAPRGPAPAIAGRAAAKLERLVAEKPDRTLEQLRERLGADVALSTVWRALRRLGLTHKKKV